MFINITKSETGGNTGSCGLLVNYLEKENRLNQGNKECWFNDQSRTILAHQVRTSIDSNIAKLGKDDSKFFLINISPSQKELAFLLEKHSLVEVKEVLKDYAIKVMDGYARNFKRSGVNSNRDLLWFGKFEQFRYYGYNDRHVKDGTKQRGDKKDGPQYHIQVIVSRKDITNTIKLSPQNTSRGKNAEHSKKLGQFDRTAFKQSGERIFDEYFGFERSFSQGMHHANTLKNGTVLDRLKLNRIEKLIERFPELLPIAGKLIKEIDNSIGPTGRMTDQIRMFEAILSEITWELTRGSYFEHYGSSAGIRELMREYYKRKRKDRKVYRYRY